ncbi:MAG: amidohydrolase family protein [Caulobacteraceae bacterium]
MIAAPSPAAAAALALSFALVAAGAAQAQDLVIANARIIEAPGKVIERGYLVVKGGRIASVEDGNAPAAAKGAKRINARGMTLIAGYIDGHRHLIQGRAPADAQAFMKDQAADRMRELLEAGFTPVQSGGDNTEAILELKRRVASGQIKGPRIIASGQVPTARMTSEAEVRALVDKVVKDGADSIAEVHYPDVVWPYHPTDQETRNLAAGIDEAKKLGVEFQVHAVSDLSLVAAVRLGAKKLVHSVNINWVTKEQAREVAAAGAEVASITGFGSPNFEVFSHDNKPKFRDGKPWPEGIIDSQGVGQEAGYMPVNLRTLHDNGVSVSYASDTTFYAPAALMHELKTLNLVFSPLDLIQIMGPNSARFVDKEKEIGTLEPGKLADIVVLAGDPRDGFWNFTTAVVVIKGGQIVVDKRGQPGAGKPTVLKGS